MEGNYQGSYQESYQGSYTQSGGMSYPVDIVMCIDATGSMEEYGRNQDRLINMVKKNALNFYDDVVQKMQEKKKRIGQLRVRVIAFRDYLADGKNAMLVTDFFNLPQQSREFKDCIDSISAQGGGDIPEDALEAMAYAIRSDWTKAAGKKRQVIVLWSDAGAHELGYGQSAPNYPTGMPRNFSELCDWWYAMDKAAKRLVLFVPTGDTQWSRIIESWDNVISEDIMADRGLSDRTYEEILNVVAGSIA